jgi:hypothetical protein
MTQNELLDAVGLGGPMRWLFEALDECGRVVEVEGVWSDLDVPYNVFKPPSEFVNKRMELYAAHVRELCGRWKASRRLSDLDHPTSAEVMLGLADTSMLAPLTQTGTALYSRLFQEIFGPDAVPELEKYAEREAWSGQLDEELARLKRRTVQRDRGKG